MARNIKANRTRISRRFSQVDRRHHSGGGSSWYQAACLIHVNKANPAIPQTILNDTFHVSCFRANRNRSVPPSKYSAARNKGVKHIKGIPTSLKSTCIGSRRAANVLARSMPRFVILYPLSQVTAENGSFAAPHTFCLLCFSIKRRDDDIPPE